MSNRYDLVTSRKDQNGKTRYTKIGVMFPAKQGEGFSLKLEALPLPNDKGEVWISAFVPRDNNDAPRGGDSRPTSQRIDDDMPF